MATLPTYTEPSAVLSQKVQLAFNPRCNTSADRYYHSLVVRNNTPTDIHLICQTPWLWLPCVPRYIVRNKRRVYFFHLAFWNIRHSPEQTEWLRFLRVLQTTFHQWVQRKHSDAHDTIQWVSCLETPFIDTYAFHDRIQDASSPNTSPVHWKFNTQLPPSVRCFDAAGIDMDDTNVLHQCQQTYMRLIVHITNVWVNEDTRTAGLGVRVLQLQQSVVAPPRTFAFNDGVPQRTCATQTTSTSYTSINASKIISEPAAETTSKPSSSTAHERTQHPVYGTYFRMCAKGVPKPAVQHKMQMNGLDPSVLNLPPEKPLPIHDDSDTSSQVSMDTLTLSLQDNHQLRKTEVNAAKENAKPSNGTGHGFGLHEIVNGLQSLRRTFRFAGRNSSSQPNSMQSNTDTAAPALKVNKLVEPGSGAKESSFLHLLASRY